MSIYTEMIRRLAPDDDPDLVEASLRSQHGTVDAIEAVHFAGEVKAAVGRMHPERTPPGGVEETRDGGPESVRWTGRR